MGFSPPLGTTTFLTASDATRPAATRLYFTYIASKSDKDSPGDRVPEIWTNLSTDRAETTSDVEPEWHAVPLSPSPEQDELYVTSLPVPSIASERAYEFTYRFRNAKTDETEWVGSSDANGKFRIVDGSRLDTRWEGPDLASVKSDDWQRFEGDAGQGDAAVGRFKLDWNEDGTTRTRDVDLGSLIPEEWCAAGAIEGLVWERSSLYWLAPRHLRGGHPLESLSPVHPGQLLVLRAKPTPKHLAHRYLVLFPFSTSNVCSYLLGPSTEGGAVNSTSLRLHCEREFFGTSTPGRQSVKAVETTGHLAVAWGAEGHLRDLVQLAISSARAAQTGEPIKDLLKAARAAAFELEDPKPLGVCTWNALSGAEWNSKDYTASAVLDWLDRLLGTETDTDEGERRSLAAGAIKSVLLDDGWQDATTYIDYDEPDGDSHATRKALKSFACRREWYDLDEEDDDDDDEQGDQEVAAARAAAQKNKKHSLDSGYDGSPVAAQLRQLDDEAREGTCVELRDVVSRIKEKGIEQVGVWMTLAGYWDGLHPEGALADTYSLRRVTLRSPVDGSDQGHMYLPVLADLRTYYTDYFTSLHAAGVDFVKVDDQSKIDWFFEQEVAEEDEEDAAPEDVGELRQAMLHEMRAAAARIFGTAAGTVIHCMAGSPRVFGGDLAVLGGPAGAGRAVIRNSDDYWPDRDDSHRWHVAINSVMTILSSALQFEPDLDMAQADHPYAGAHLPLRTFSSAKIYATDTDSVEGWSSLVATTRNGPRALQARAAAASGAVLEGRLWDDVLSEQATRGGTPALIAGLPVPNARGAHLGIWNCSKNGSATAVLDSKDVGEALQSLRKSDAATEEPSQLVLTDTDGSFATIVESADVAGPVTGLRNFAKPIHAIHVSQTQAHMLVLAPLMPLGRISSSAGDQAMIGCLGLLGKTAGLAAIRSIRVGKQGIAASGSALDEFTRKVDSGPSQRPEGLVRSVRSDATPTARAFPSPQGRLPFLLAYVAGFFRHSSTTEPGASSNTSGRRSPRAELSAMTREFLRSPFRTFFGELRALVTFSYAAIVWAASGSSRSGERVQGRVGSPAGSAASPLPATSAQTSGASTATIEIELDYVSDRLGFYLSTGLTKDSLHFTLDGHDIDSSSVRTNKHTHEIVEVDVEKAWRASTSADTGLEGTAISKPWVVGVSLNP